MNTNKIRIDPSEPEMQTACGRLARSGEHNKTEIEFVIPEALRGGDKYILEYQLPNGTKIAREAAITPEGTIVDALTQQITATRGEIKIQAAAYKLDGLDVEMIGKTAIVRGLILPSLNGVEAEAEEEPGIMDRVVAALETIEEIAGDIEDLQTKAISDADVAAKFDDGTVEGALDELADGLSQAGKATLDYDYDEEEEDEPTYNGYTHEEAIADIDERINGKVGASALSAYQTKAIPDSAGDFTTDTVTGALHELASKTLGGIKMGTVTTPDFIHFSLGGTTLTANSTLADLVDAINGAFMNDGYFWAIMFEDYAIRTLAKYNSNNLAYVTDLTGDNSQKTENEVKAIIAALTGSNYDCNYAPYKVPSGNSYYSCWARDVKTNANKTELDYFVPSLMKYGHGEFVNGAFVVTERTVKQIDAALSGKQDTISDLATIRSNATAGAAKQPTTITDAGGYFTTDTVEGALAELGAERTKTVTQTAPTTLTLADNTEYRLTDVDDLTITYPSGNFEVWMSITTAASGTVTITLPSSSYIGDTPTFGNGETWEVSIKDGVVIAQQAVIPS